MKKSNLFTTQNMVIMAMLSAVAYMLMVFVKIPVVMFLKYEPKDVIIVIAGFIFGPLAAFVMSAVVSFIEMFTVSDTGWIGFAMNMLSTCSFACAAAFIYKRKRSIQYAIIGLVTGCMLMVAVMLLWNYLLTPIYMNVPRETIKGMLLTVFLPFNLLKGILNASTTMLIYKPIVKILRKQHLMPIYSGSQPLKGRLSIVIILVSALLIAGCIVYLLFV